MTKQPKIISMKINGAIRSKKNSKRVIRDRAGRTRVLSSQNYENEKDGIMYQMLPHRPPQPVKTPSRVSFILYMQDRVRRDLDNSIQGYLDMLVEVGVLEDDTNTIVSELFVKMGGVDRKNPHAIIIIEPLPEPLSE